MKINLAIILFIFVLSIATCFPIGAQTNDLGSSDFTTNIYSLNPNDLKDETGNEYPYYVDKVLHHNVMPETLPANLDTNGSWGLATNGLQLSLRFRGQEYVVGEVIPAISILRNLESHSQTLLLTNSQSWFFTFFICSGTNGYLPERKVTIERRNFYSPPIAPPSGLSSWKWEARSEKEIVLKLDRIFDLTQPGEYTIQAICRIYSPETKLPLFEVSSGTTSFRIVPKPAPTGSTSTNSPP